MKPQPWEVMPLPGHIVEKIRNFLRLEEFAPIPTAVWKTFTDFLAEPTGEYMADPITESTVKWLLQLAELKYPSEVVIDLAPGTPIRSGLYNRDGVFVRQVALGRALINCNGAFFTVNPDDLTVKDLPEEVADETTEKPARNRRKLASVT